MDETKEPSQENEVEVANKKNENGNLNNLLMINSLYYIVVMILIGFPIWYFTTGTYRASLPFNQIDQLSSINSFSAAFDIELVILDSDKKSSFAQIANQFKQTFNKDDKILLDFKVNVRSASKNEIEFLSKYKTIQDFDESTSGKNLNLLKIFVLDDELSAKYGLTKSNDYIFLNSLFVSDENIDYVKLAGYLRSEYLHQDKLKRSFDSKLNILRKLPEKNDLKVINFDSEYEITFTLINELPERFKTWNIDFCIGKYFQKIIDQLSLYTTFKLKAQTLLYSDFDSYQITQYTQPSEGGSQFYYLKTSDLSIMTNFMEGRLGARVSDSAALEFVTYLSSKQPLYIVSNVNNPNESKSNSFLVPRWGGVFIYNSQNEHDNSVVADDAVKTFLFQFIDLIGIKLNQNPRKIPRSRIYDSELFGYLLEKTFENQLNSINTLKSLSSLLTRISNMVIEDKIADKVQHAVDSLEKSRDYLQKGDLVNAFHASKAAFVSSETAFFDKSLLEKLYFPEDQRYAIYIPLFIPVAIPIVMSALTVVKKKFKKD